MTPAQQHLILARKSAIGEVWAALEAEEARAKANRKSPNWRKVLKTHLMREDAAQSKGITPCK